MIYFICLDGSQFVGKEVSMSLSDFEREISDGSFSGLACSSEPVKAVERYVRSLDSQQDSFSKRSDISRYHLFQLRSMLYRVAVAPICVVQSFYGGDVKFSVCPPFSSTLADGVVETYQSWHEEFGEIEKDLKNRFARAVASDEAKNNFQEV